MAYTNPLNLIEKVQKFRIELASWITAVQYNRTVLQPIADFFRSQNVEDVKLSKTKEETPVIGRNFSILRLRNQSGAPVFRIVSHELVGTGGFAKIKIAFPVSINLEAKTLKIDTRIPMALKVLRYHSEADPHTGSLPTATAIGFLGEKYPDVFAYGSRKTDSKKSFYPQGHERCGQDLDSNLKKYLCTPLFDAIELLEYLDGIPKKNLEPLSEIDVMLIVLGILEEVKLLNEKRVVHRDIKAENILINKKTKAVFLIDYDMSAVEGSDCIAAGTRDYVSKTDLGRIKEGMEKVSVSRDNYALSIIFTVLDGLYLRTPSEAKFFVLNIIRFLNDKSVLDLKLELRLKLHAPIYYGAHEMRLPPKDVEQFGGGAELVMSLA